MHKWLGLPIPAKRTIVDTKEKNKDYDKNKRRRTIVPSWKEEFKWLISDETATNSGKLYCQQCRGVYGPLAIRKTASDRIKRYANGPFVVGSTNLKHDALTTHEKSEGHKYAVEITASRNKPQGESSAEKILHSLNKATVSKLEKLFRNAHAVAKKSRPITDYVWLCELDEQKGIDLGSTYKNHKSCKEFMVSIAEVERYKIEEKLAEVKFCTIMSDGSTDVSVSENEIVYIHFAHRGVPYCYFLGLIECESANSEGIYNAIKEALHFKNISVDSVLKKTIAFAGDGASVNTGHLNGVIAHFRRNVSPSIIMVQCMSHRVELAYKAALKVAPVFTKVHGLLDELFKFYHKSAKQTKDLKNTFIALGMSQRLPTRIGGTRWLGHVQTALKSLWKGYKAFVTHLSQVALKRSGQSATQSKAKYLVKLLRSKDVIIFAHFLTDLVGVLTQFSMCLQKRATCFYEVHQELQCTIANIKKLENRPGPELRKIVDAGDQFEGETLIGNDLSSDQIKRVLKGLTDSLEGRFSDVNDGVKNATKIADLTSWPASLEEATDFGDEMVQTLVDHYRQQLLEKELDVGLIESEWTVLRNFLYNNHRVHGLSWSTVNDLYISRVPNILSLVDLVLSLPAGTSECERGFSQMKIIKSQWRNKLKSSSMTLLMTIQLNSESVAEWNPEKSIFHWNRNAKRRPCFMESRKRPVSIQREILELDEQEESEETAEEAEGERGEKEHSDLDDSDYTSDFSDLDDDSCDSEEYD